MKYLKVKNNIVWRINVECTLGNITDEDRKHSERQHQIIEWGDQVREVEKLKSLPLSKEIFGEITTQTIGTQIVSLLSRKSELLPSINKLESHKDTLQHRLTFLSDLLNWQQIEFDVKAMPSKRDGHSACYYKRNQKLIIFGGNQEKGPINDLWEFDLGTFCHIQFLICIR
jgi:hypothetical protein